MSSNAVLSILFIFFALISGSLILYFTSRNYFSRFLPPYTVFVFLVGVIFSEISRSSVAKGSTDPLLNAIDQFSHIHPDLLLYIFLPALLFGEAMTLNFYQVRKAFIGSILLALPGMAFGAWLLAIFIYYCTNFGWSWRLCFVIGATLGATDPVSVVAALKELSASSPSAMKLTYLIVGEAFLNDASALVLFDALMSKDYDTPSAITIYFVRVMFISPIVGALLGLLCVLALRLLNRRVSHDDCTMQMALTLCCAYISFFLGQYILKVSGVISCVTAGVMLSWLAPPLFLQPESLEVVWHTLEWTANTLIFMLAGLIVGKFINQTSAEAWAAIFVIYILLFLIRILMLVICHPIIYYLSPDFSWRDSIFTSMAGLRGAVSLALTLIIHGRIEVSPSDSHDVTFPSENIDTSVFVISGVVALTIVINGTLSTPFYEYLYKDRMTSNKSADSIIFHYVQKRIKNRSIELLDKLHYELPIHHDKTIVTICEGIFGNCRNQLVDFLSQNDSFDEIETIMNPLYPDHPTYNDSVDDLSRLSLQTVSSAGDESGSGSASIDPKPINSNSLWMLSHDQPISSTHDSSVSISSPTHNNISIRMDYDNPTFRTPIEVETSPRASHQPLLGGGGLTRRIRSIPDSPFNGIQRTISSQINNALINKFRIIFLGVLRKCYLRQIQVGRLPRGSNAALILLNSIDVGLETVHTDGLQDWDAVKISLDAIEGNLKLLNKFDLWISNILDDVWLDALAIKKIVQETRSYLLSNKVYVLTSFVDAHKYAQVNIPFYLGESEGTSVTSNMDIYI